MLSELGTKKEKLGTPDEEHRVLSQLGTIKQTRSFMHALRT